MKKQLKITLASFGVLSAIAIPAVLATSCQLKKVDVIWNKNEEGELLVDEHIKITSKPKQITYKQDFNIQADIDDGYELDIDNTSLYIDNVTTKSYLQSHIVVRKRVDTEKSYVLHIDGKYITGKVCVFKFRTKSTSTK